MYINIYSNNKNNKNNNNNNTNNNNNNNRKNRENGRNNRPGRALQRGFRMNDSIMRGYGTSIALPLCMTGMPTSYASARHRPCMRQPKSQEKKKRKKTYAESEVSI